MMRNQTGNAVIELVAVAVVLMVPLAWGGIAIARLVGVQQATEQAARDAIRAAVLATDDLDARRRGQMAVELALAPYAESITESTVQWSCSAPPCLRPGNQIEVSVVVKAHLPPIPVLGTPVHSTARADHAGVVDVYAYLP